MKRTKEEIDRILNRAGKAYAKTYMLMTCAIDYADEGDNAIAELGMYRTEIKQNAVRVQKSFDRFCTDFKKYLSKGDGKVILADWERVSKGVDKILERVSQEIEEVLEDEL